MIARLLLPLALLAAAADAEGPFDPFGVARIDERLGVQIPLDAPLVDSAGRATTLRLIGGGRPILLAPVLHDCPNLCGVTLADLVDAVAAQPQRDVRLVAFGIDPAEGAQAAAADLDRLRRAAPAAARLGVAAVVGPARSIRAITDALGYRYAWDARIGQYAHAAAVAALTPDGRLSGWLYGVDPAPAAVATAIGDAAAGRTGSWTERLLLLCYHYDPQTGRYTPAIEKILRVAAFATLLALGALVLRLRRRASA